jgi:DNA (cytosine-5)-methyltransferase 1
MVAQPIATSFYANEGSHGMGDNTEVSVTLKAHPKTSNLAAVSIGMAVRRLTPRECERLQGFPDDYTAIPGAADGPRYKALGNSMAVPVMAWIGTRINNATLKGE